MILAKNGIVLVCVVALPAMISSAYQAEDSGRGLTGSSILTADYHGTPLYLRLELTQAGEKLTGKFGSREQS
jgi:amidase